MNADAPVAVFAHGFQDGGHRCDLPVAFAAVAVALRHEVLGREAGQLFHAIEVLERVGEGFAALRIHHLLHSDLFARLIADGSDIVGRKIVLFAVNGHELVNFRFRDGVHFLDQIANGPCVDFPAEFLLDFDFIALGDSHVAHIVAETHDFHVLRDGDADGGLHPAADAGLHILVLPVPSDNLARLAQARADEAVFPVAVRGLIEVHEVHVDFFIGNLTVILGRKVQPRLLEHIQAVDPHFGRAECMAPCDDTGAGIIIISLFYDLRDLSAGFGCDLIFERIRQDGGQLLRHLLRTPCDSRQNILAVERLRADDKPEFIMFHI